MGEVNMRTWGVDLVEEAIFTALGIPARPLAPEKPLTCTAWNLVNARKSGQIHSVESIEALQEGKDVALSMPLVKPGDYVTGAGDGLPTWLCMIMTSGETSELSLQLALDLESNLELEIDSVR